MHCLKNQNSREDRRRSNVRLPGLRIYSLGIVRESRVAEDVYIKHDEAFSHYDSEKWQTAYSLHEHCIIVSRVSATTTAERGGDEKEVSLSRIAGLLHDIGKLSEACHIYRLNRKLSLEEKRRVSKHARLSSIYILSRLRKVRPQDRKFLKRACVPIKWHHKPWRVIRPRLRMIAWDIMLSDIFTALMETRHRPGLSQFEAIEALPEVVAKKVPRLFQFIFGREIKLSIDALTRLYGKESIALLP